MPPGLATFLAEVIALTVREIAKNIDVIYAAWQRAANSTATDAKPDPELKHAVDQSIQDAIARGDVPPP